MDAYPTFCQDSAARDLRDSTQSRLHPQQANCLSQSCGCWL